MQQFAWIREVITYAVMKYDENLTKSEREAMLSPGNTTVCIDVPIYYIFCLNITHATKFGHSTPASAAVLQPITA